MSSPLIPKERLSSYHRWELHAFDQPAAPAAPPPTADSGIALAQIRQTAYRAGYDDGLRAGLQKAAADGACLVEMLASLRLKAADLDQLLSDELLDLALEIARQMVRQGLLVRRELIIPLVEDALARIATPLSQTAITLHPADAAIVREHLAQQVEAVGCKIIEDETIKRGGCTLQSAASEIDATLGTRWQQLARALGRNSLWLE